jgi:competence protein ComEA
MVSPLVDRLDQVLVRLDRVRDRPGLSLALAVVVLTVIGAGWWLGRPASSRPIETLIPFASTTVVAQPGDDGLALGPVTGAPEVSSPGSEEGESAGSDGEEEPPGRTGAAVSEPAEVMVHVAGAVRLPGLVRLPAGSRINDAVEAAGGPTDDADLHQLNLAAPVLDGMQIRVPVAGEIVAYPAGTVAPGAASGSGTSGPGWGGSGDPPGLVDLNRASAEQLEALPGIGPALGQAIVEWREAHGPFRSVDDLASVPGIGPAKLAALADRATV